LWNVRSARECYPIFDEIEEYAVDVAVVGDKETAS
jgi:hypothetical protein